MMPIKTCQCQKCIYCHGGGCGDDADVVIRFKEHNGRAEVAVCELCYVGIMGGYPGIFEKVEREPVP